MNTKTYETIQGTLSFLVLGSLAIALTFTIDYFQLANALDLSIWGQTFMPSIIAGAWAIFALAVIAKVWGAYVNFRFAYRIEIANKFYAVANKIDPRRNQPLDTDNPSQKYGGFFCYQLVINFFTNKIDKL